MSQPVLPQRLGPGGLAYAASAFSWQLYTNASGVSQQHARGYGLELDMQQLEQLQLQQQLQHLQLRRELLQQQEQQQLQQHGLLPGHPCQQQQSMGSVRTVPSLLELTQQQQEQEYQARLLQQQHQQQQVGEGDSSTAHSLFQLLRRAATLQEVEYGLLCHQQAIIRGMAAAAAAESAQPDGIPADADMQLDLDSDSVGPGKVAAIVGTCLEATVLTPRIVVERALQSPLLRTHKHRHWMEPQLQQWRAAEPHALRADAEAFVGGLLHHVKECLRSAVAGNKPSHMLLRFHEQVNDACTMCAHRLLELKAVAGVEGSEQHAAMAHVLLQLLYAVCRQLVLGSLFEQAHQQIVQDFEPAPVGHAEQPKLYYIAGYLVSTLIVRHIQHAKKAADARNSRQRDGRQPVSYGELVDWLYVQCLEVCKLGGDSTDAVRCVPNPRQQLELWEEVPAELQEFTQAVDRGGLTYSSKAMYDWLVQVEEVVRSYLDARCMSQDSVQRLKRVLLPASSTLLTSSGLYRPFRKMVKAALVKRGGGGAAVQQAVEADQRLAASM